MSVEHLHKLFFTTEDLFKKITCTKTPSNRGFCAGFFGETYRRIEAS